MLSVTPWTLVDDAFANYDDASNTADYFVGVPVDQTALTPLAASAPGGFTLPAGFENYDANDWYTLTQIEGLNFSTTNLTGGVNSVGENRITWENIGGTMRLTALKVNEMGLTGTLDMSGCTALRVLQCNVNHLTGLNVSGCMSLGWLNCEHNRLTSLDLTTNTALVWVPAGSNQLSVLDVSKNTKLEYLDCRFNQLESLDVSANLVLERT